MPPAVYFVGVDVGTSSARAALVSDNGKIVKTAVENIEVFNPQPDFFEQSSDNIWLSCCKCIKRVTSGVNPHDVKGIGFDATCSLVALDKDGQPLSISPLGSNNHNVILWLDHRASQEADKINSLKHSVLKYVGGKISLEMQTPKLLWIKNNLRRQWDRVGFFFDLPDFLTWKATRSDSRSLCSLVCKWTYEMTPEGDEGWNASYFKAIGLEDLEEHQWLKIGSDVLPPGTPVGEGLVPQAASQMGLKAKVPVGASAIDAHAGGIGLIGCQAAGINPDFNSRLSLICGTSTCHMAVSEVPLFTPGVWGPYFSAMVPGMWLSEGGQSATGKLIDHVIDSHPATPDIKKKIKNMHIQIHLSNVLKQLAKKENLENEAFLTKDLHVWPDFHGNRSPVADPTLKGAICGLTLGADEESLALLYLATVQALAYGTKHILDALIKSGHSTIKSILICGGLSKNLLFTQTQADVVHLPVVCPDVEESVLVGSAILGACAAEHFPNMAAAIKAMGGEGKVMKPNPAVTNYHKKKYEVFLKMYEHQVQYRKIMQ